MSRILYGGARLESVIVLVGNPFDSSVNYDPAWSDAGLQVVDPGGSPQGAQFPCLDAAMAPTTCPDNSDFFLHMYVHFRHSGRSQDNFVFVDSSGNPYVRIHSTPDSNFQLFANTGTGVSPIWVQLGTDTPQSAFNWDIQISINSAGSHSVRLFQDQVLTPTLAGTFVCADFTNIAAVNAVTGYQAGEWLSQVILTEDVPTIGARVKTSRATGAGHYSDWAGSYTDVNEVGDDDTTVNQSTVVGDKQSYPMSDITTPAGYMMHSVFCWLRGKESGVAPQNIVGLLYSGGTDYTTGVLPNLDLGFSSVGMRFDEDPATSAPWTDSGYNAAELGFVSAT